jgi:hypothetical protein
MTGVGKDGVRSRAEPSPQASALQSGPDEPTISLHLSTPHLPFFLACYRLAQYSKLTAMSPEPKVVRWGILATGGPSFRLPAPRHGDPKHRLTSPLPCRESP